MTHLSPYASYSPGFGNSRSSVVSHGDRKCAVPGCKKIHCKRESQLGEFYEYSEHCKDHSCLRKFDNHSGFCSAPAMQPRAGVCVAHSMCSSPGCSKQGKNSEPNSALAWFCSTHRCHHGDCIIQSLPGRKHCQRHLACAERNCDRVPAEKGTFCKQHECSLPKCHQRANEAGRCEKHRECHISSCDQLAMADGYFCSDHGCRIVGCDLSRAKKSFFCMDRKHLLLLLTLLFLLPLCQSLSRQLINPLKDCCKVSDCSAGRHSMTKPDAAYCSRHECYAQGCINPAEEHGLYCVALHSCTKGGCLKERSIDASRHETNLCAEHFLEQIRLETAAQIEMEHQRREARHEQVRIGYEELIRQHQEQNESAERQKDRETKKRLEAERLEKAYQRGKQAERERLLKKQNEAKRTESEAQGARAPAMEKRGSGAKVHDFSYSPQRGRDDLPSLNTSQHQSRQPERTQGSTTEYRVYEYPAGQQASPQHSSTPRSVPQPPFIFQDPRDVWEDEPEGYYTTYSPASSRQQQRPTHADHGRQSTHYQPPPPPPPPLPRRTFSPEQVVYAQYPVVPERQPSYRHVPRRSFDGNGHNDYGIPYVYGSGDSRDHHRRARAPRQQRDEPLPYPDPQEHIERQYRRSDGGYRY
ncbi:uncharacterized protein B0I36DRAFT_319252 [Microdochium trichocladiopsis]|uniref:Uncharacterized protein n=1 Tax=Microdochium trichocladiopsis TaxID=1682393 RepID=A0A9P8YCJ1_9PEZI|nr:uncharacterized protein B0I36DRAFT_319252 [Microdochium trichocladiopsis]KAH7035871.1 hypothetical protein B0I36DRAFT_319252 [Microdochium trichocladiopsis]